MSDSTAGLTALVPAELLQLAQAPQVPAFDPKETRMFATLMQEAVPVVSGAADTLRGAALSVAEQLKGPNLDDLRLNMLQGIHWNDPVASTFTALDYSMQVHATFTKLHLASGLAEAAVNLFGGLLKNQN